MCLSCVKAIWITFLSFQIKKVFSRETHTSNPEAFYLAEYLHRRKKKEQLHPPTKCKNYAMCTIIIQKKAYCISHIHISKKNKLINKQCSISLQQRHNEKDAMTSSVFLTDILSLKSQCTPSVYPLGKVKIEHITLCNSPKTLCHDSLSMQCYTEETQLTSQLPGACIGHAAVVEWRS